MQDVSLDRRRFLALAGIGGAVFASNLNGWARPAGAATAHSADFFFVQLSDTHWGFNDPAINPDAEATLHKAIAAVNALEPQPDFVVFTGDLTHTTDDPGERRRRLTQFRDIVRGLRARTVRFMPGEHDASLDGAAAYRELFGPTFYAFEHKGVHFIVLDNVSDPTAAIGPQQLRWLSGQLAKVDKDRPVVVLTHRPLFDLYPQWDWSTRDGAEALALLEQHPHVTVFYGHIHQEHHFQTGNIEHHSARSLMFPLPAPGSAPKRRPIAWDPATPYKGLGFREVGVQPLRYRYALTELPVQEGAA
jgi:3',5'-cyclic AMP phosphodiesterase CpdA